MVESDHVINMGVCNEEVIQLQDRFDPTPNTHSAVKKQNDVFIDKLNKEVGILIRKRDLITKTGFITI